MQKLLSFMKQFQLNKNNIKSKEKEWIKKSKFIENQA